MENCILCHINLVSRAQKRTICLLRFINHPVKVRAVVRRTVIRCICCFLCQALSLCQKGDIVVTQDYGVAAMILGKGAYGIHQSGKWYTDENIDQMLMERHLTKKARNSKKKHHLKGPAKRTEADDKRFEVSLNKLIEMYIKDR